MAYDRKPLNIWKNACFYGILQSTFADLEDFYETIVLPPPARKPKGKPTVENHVRYLEIHLVEKLKEKIYVSFEDLNAEIKK